MDAAARPERDVLEDDGVRPDDAADAELRAGLDEGAGTDAHVGVQLGARFHHRCRMNAHVRIRF